MFSQNQEVKLEWMYKGPHSTVEREDYLLGRSVDKALEQINTEEKQQPLIAQPKNHVEHECIPPSIREYKQQQGEQVDIQTKLQEDPLFAIKKQEEEKRRQFLNNPVQIKKLQKALKAQKKAKDSDKDLDAKLINKLKLLKNDNLIGNKTKKSKKDNLDIILMHKYNKLKSKLSDTDLQDIFDGKIDSSSSSSESGNSSSEEQDKNSDKRKKKYKRKSRSRSVERTNYRQSKHNEQSRYPTAKQNKHRSRSRDHTDKYKSKEKYKNVKELHKHNSQRSRSHDRIENKRDIRRRSQRSRSPNDKKDVRRRSQRSGSRDHLDHNKDLRRRSQRSRSPIDHQDKHRQSNLQTINNHSSSDSCSDSERPKKKNWGLVKADGTKIPLSVKPSSSTYIKSQATSTSTQVKPSQSQRQRLTEEEKEKRRQEMLRNATWHEKERTKNLEEHRRNMDREDEDRKKAYEPKFLQKELLKSANVGSVESRIKANINNIQRSGSDMNKHFSRR